MKPNLRAAIHSFNKEIAILSQELNFTLHIVDLLNRTNDEVLEAINAEIENNSDLSHPFFDVCITQLIELIPSPLSSHPMIEESLAEIIVSTIIAKIELENVLLEVA